MTPSASSGYTFGFEFVTAPKRRLFSEKFISPQNIAHIVQQPYRGRDSDMELIL